MAFVKEGLSTEEEILVYLFLIPTTLLNIYMLFNFLNIIRALSGTRCFTDKPIKGGLVRKGEEPTVTIQICVYNEAAVVRRTIDAACQVDWPKDKLYVQILDDSNDQTSGIIEEAAEEWRARGVNCHRLTRPNRIGYKAGNLGAHTKDVQGEFVALFDSDHRCERNYLRRAIPQFFNEDGSSKAEIGLVQTPWAYYNTHQNMLTEFDSLTLDFSHAIEQVARFSALQCFGFNGTGGVWRNSAIEAAGGWKWDTVTEDIDISYLAHLEGYRFVYLRDVPQQLECPAHIRAYRQQKHRWGKGYMQVARKSLWHILTSPKASLAVKLEAFFHMTRGVCYVNLVLIFILSPLIASIDAFTMGLTIYANWPLVSFWTAVILTIYSKVPSSNNHYRDMWSRTLRLLFVPVQLVLGTGTVIFETVAFLDGIFNDDATFHRTPKEGMNHLNLYDVDSDDEVEEEEEEEEDADDVEAGHEHVVHKKKTKMVSPFVAETLEGLAGLCLSAYLVFWTRVLVQSAFEDSSLSSSSGRVIPGFLGLIPAAGLFYMHSSFLLATFHARYKTWRKHARERAAASRTAASKAGEGSDPTAALEESEQGQRSTDDEGDSPSSSSTGASDVGDDEEESVHP